MASDYPAFIFQDAIPAQQMMAHAQAVNEGMRIQELGKARQAEGMFRMAQMQQQQKAQREKNELDRMLAMSQIEQNRIANEFREKELMQRGTLEAERNKNYAERSKLEFSPDRIFPQEALLERKIELEEEDRKRQEAEELKRITENERAIEDLNRKEVELRKMQSSGAKNLNLPVLQRNIGDVVVRRNAILNSMSKVGYDWDPTARRFTGVNRPTTTEYRPSRDGVGVSRDVLPDIPSASDLTVRPTLLGDVGTASLTPFEMQVRGLQPGSTVQQGGGTFAVSPSFPAGQPPSASAMTGDTTLDEYSRRYPGVQFVRDGNTIRAGGYDWDENMRKIAEDPGIDQARKSALIEDYIRRKYPDLFRGSSQDAFQRYVPAVGRAVGGMLQNILPGTLGR